jgi:hypothetical protein
MANAQPSRTQRPPLKVRQRGAAWRHGGGFLAKSRLDTGGAMKRNPRGAAKRSRKSARDLRGGVNAQNAFRNR